MFVLKLSGIQTLLIFTKCNKKLRIFTNTLIALIQNAVIEATQFGKQGKLEKSYFIYLLLPI